MGFFFITCEVDPELGTTFHERFSRDSEEAAAAHVSSVCRGFAGTFRGNRASLRNIVQCFVLASVYSGYSHQCIGTFGFGGSSARGITYLR